MRLSEYRSGLEDAISDQLKAAEVPFKYEKYKVTYSVPAVVSRYTPDFILGNGVIVETKGRFVTADRKKHRLIKSDHPELDIRFVFSNPKTKIGKKSKTSYADWCDQYGFKWHPKVVPDIWTKELLTPDRLEYLKTTIGWEP